MAEMSAAVRGAMGVFGGVSGLLVGVSLSLLGVLLELDGGSSGPWVLLARSFSLSSEIRLV